jgi:hypothetical protein
MKKVFFGMLAIVLLVAIASCNKDQRAVKRLSGEWTLIKAGGFDVSADNELAQTMSFNECSLKDNEYCDVTITNSEGSETTKYRVTDKGETLVYKDEDNKEQKMTIVTLEKEKLVLKMNVEGFGSIDMEFKKK